MVFEVRFVLKLTLFILDVFLFFCAFESFAAPTRPPVLQSCR